MAEHKIVSTEEFEEIRRTYRRQGKKVVLAHGVFDLFHYGHMEHLLDAKRQGDVLVVSVTAAEYVNKGPGRPYFTDKQRMFFLSNLEVVDHVLLSEATTAQEIIRAVQPDIYAKGEEYRKADNDITGNIGDEEEEVRKYGGTIYYTKGEVYSSTRLLNNFFSALPDNVAEKSLDLKRHYGFQLMNDIRQYVDAWKEKKVLVVGDVILDEYVFCNVQGITMKDGTISTLFDYEERYTGGALAVAKHMAEFSDHVTLCSMIGKEPGIDTYIRKNMGAVSLELVEDAAFITPIKRRYLKQNAQRQEYDKLFSFNRLMGADDIRTFDYTAFCERLSGLLPNYDVVVVCDFGHGLINEEAMRLIHDKASFVCLNCQTNSANMGTNVITKYAHADMFVVDERELHLAIISTIKDREDRLAVLKERLSAVYAWVTIGAEGAIGMSEGQTDQSPALTLRVKDTVGAGDAFFAIASLCAATRVPMPIATLLANAAGALKTNIIGNKESVKRVELLKYVNTVLNV